MKRTLPAVMLCVALCVFALFLLPACGAPADDAAEEGALSAFAASPSEEEEAPEGEDILVLELPSPTPLPTPTPEPTPPVFTVDEVDEQGGYVNAGGVNLRSGPHTDYEVISVLELHTPLTVTGKSENDWYRVELEGLVGYLRGDFVGIGPLPTPTPKPYTITKMSSTTAYVNAGSVNFREGPGKSYDVIAECERYEKVTITGTTGDWYRVKYNKKTGYMLKSYVRIGLSPANYKSVGKYTPADVLLMAQICYRESSKGSEEGYKAVASVVLNRVSSSKYPNTIEKVVFQGNGAQFSPADNPNSLRLTKPSDMCVKAVSEILQNGSMLPGNVMYFRTASRGTSWGSTRVYYNTYGGNCFFS